VLKTVATLAAAPATLVLLLGAALGTPLPTSGTPAGAEAPAAYPSDLPSPPAAFAGAASGCTVPDPTGTGGCVTPATAWLLDQVELHFGPLPTSCWDAHAWNPTSDHPRGKACDVTFGTLGTFPGPDDVGRGWILAEWLRTNADPLQISYLIWQGRIWSSARADQGWRDYTGGGIYNPEDAAGGHFDHLHLSARI